MRLWSWPGSNRRPPAYKTDALTDCATRPTYIHNISLNDFYNKN